jgi:phospholipid-binding lipoprotein MlaA
MFNRIIKILLVLLFYSVSDAALAEDKNMGSVGRITEMEDNPEDFNFGSDSSATEIYDPLEKVNRKIFAFNEVFDRYFFEHVARGYRDYVPKPIRNSTSNFLHNLSLPIVVVNSALQGDLNNSMASFSTFLINTTIGIGGLFDVARSKKIRYNSEDFGQTFAKYKIGQGPYLVLPFLGPSDLRDATGLAVEKLVDPLAFNVLEVGGSRELIENEEAYGLAAMTAIDVRVSLLDTIDDIRKNSFDVYATIRSAYLQKRNSLINNK